VADNTKNADEILSVKQAAQVIGYSVSGMHSLTDRGVIPFEQAAPNCQKRIRLGELAQRFPGSCGAVKAQTVGGADAMNDTLRYAYAILPACPRCGSGWLYQHHQSQPISYQASPTFR